MLQIGGLKCCHATQKQAYKVISFNNWENKLKITSTEINWFSVSWHRKEFSSRTETILENNWKKLVCMKKQKDSERFATYFHNSSFFSNNYIVIVIKAVCYFLYFFFYSVETYKVRHRSRDSESAGCLGGHTDLVLCWAVQVSDGPQSAQQQAAWREGDSQSAW